MRTKTVTQNLYAGAADLAPGYMVQPEFSSTGGSRTQSNVEDRAGQAVLTKRVSFDHPDLQEGSQILINKAYTTLRRYSAPTFAGMWFCPQGDFQDLDSALQELRNAAFTLNNAALKLGSKRHTVVEVFAFDVNPSDIRTRLRIGLSAYEHLTSLRESYTGEDRNSYIKFMRHTKNFGKILTGTQREIVQAALDASDAQRPLMIRHYGGFRGTSDLAPGETFDYGPIDRARLIFEPATKAF